jgi:hypothetical protein
MATCKDLLDMPTEDLLPPEPDKTFTIHGLRKEVMALDKQRMELALHLRDALEDRDRLQRELAKAERMMEAIRQGSLAEAREYQAEIEKLKAWREEA